METLGPLKRVYRGYIGIIGCILRIFWDLYNHPLSHACVSFALAGKLISPVSSGLLLKNII